MIQDQVSELPVLDRISIEYILYPASKRRTDLGNVLSIHQKFFEDALVELTRLVDDDYKHIIHTQFSFGEVTPKDPKVLIQIKEIN